MDELRVFSRFGDSAAGDMTEAVWSSQQLLVFCRRAKRECPSLFQDWNPSRLVLPRRDALMKAGKEMVCGFLYDHTRDALVSEAQTLTRGLVVESGTTKAEVRRKEREREGERWC